MHKTTFQRKAILFVLLLGVADSSRLAHADSGSLPPPTSVRYQFTIIDIPNQQFMAPFAPSNDSGMACGFYIDLTGLAHGFLWQEGKVVPLDAPGAPQTIATGINDHGMVTGTFGDLDSGTPFIYNVHNGSWTELPPPPAGAPLRGLPSVAINNRGIIALPSGITDGPGPVWTWDGRSYSEFAGPPSIFIIGFGINDRGQAAGGYVDPQGKFHGFLKDGATFTTIDVPGADATEAFSINNQGDIAGQYVIFSPEFKSEGFILHHGQFVTVPVPGDGGISGINDHGELGGCYPDSLGVWHGFIATPVGNHTAKP